MYDRVFQAAGKFYTRSRAGWWVGQGKAQIMTPFLVKAGSARGWETGRKRRREDIDDHEHQCFASSAA